MRVLHVTDAYLPRVGGIEMHVHDLARAQRAAGDDVDVITLTRGRDSLDSPAGAKVVRPRDDAGTAAKAAFLADHRRYGDRHGYDVIHAHCSTVSLLSYATLGTRGEVPRLMTVHSLWRRYTGIYRGFDHLVGWSRWPVRWSAVSEVAAQAVRRSAAGPLDVAVLSNGIDLTAWQPVEHDAEPGTLRLLAVMRLAARKRPTALLRILRSLRERTPEHLPLRASIVGDGPARQSMQRYLDRHGMQWVTLHGQLPRSEIARLMASSDVFVAPAVLESFGIAALEARAAGLPVVGRTGTGLAEFIRDGEGGVLVDSDAQMAHVLARMATERIHETVPPSSWLAAMDWPAVVARTRALYADAGAATPAAAAQVLVAS